MQPIKVITSGFENLCAFYALFNSIGGKPREIRQEVYANMGLNSKVADEYFAESILPLLEDFDKTMDFKKKLQSDDTLAWSEILKYQKEMFVPKDLVDSERIQMENHVQTNLELRWRNTESKKGLIDEYANFLFYGNGSAVDVRKFPNAITKSSPYNLEEFSELMRIYQHSDVQNLLDVIDDSICYLRIEDEMDPGKYMMVPSVALKFLANFCHNKLWIGKWQNESRVTNGDMERAVYEDSGDYVNPFGADNNLHLQDFLFF